MSDLLLIHRKCPSKAIHYACQLTPSHSFVEESELSAIKGPFAIAAAETDHIFPTEKRHKSETILMETKQPYQINLYSGVVHGFAVRCDVTKKNEKYAKEQAFIQAVTWFDEHLL
jgi:dienelactone hydrolase